MKIISVRCISLSLRSKTRRRATFLIPTWVCSRQSGETVNFALPFTTSVTILISILQTFRSLEATSNLRDIWRLKSSLRKFYCRYGDLIKQYEIPLSGMLHDILEDDHIQLHPPLIRHYTIFYPVTELDLLSVFLLHGRRFP